MVVFNLESGCIQPAVRTSIADRVDASLNTTCAVGISKKSKYERHYAYTTKEIQEQSIVLELELKLRC